MSFTKNKKITIIYNCEKNDCVRCQQEIKQIEQIINQTLNNLQDFEIDIEKKRINL